MDHSTNTSPEPSIFISETPVSEPPFASADDALRHAYNTIAKSCIGLRGTLAVGGGGELSPAEQMAQAAMIINVIRDGIRDPYRCAISGAMLRAVDWPARIDKVTQLKILSTWVTCPNRRYKMHCLGTWSGMHHASDNRWAKEIGVTTRTLYRWREGKPDGVTRQADRFLEIGLSLATDLFRESGIIS